MKRAIAHTLKGLPFVVGFIAWFAAICGRFGNEVGYAVITLTVIAAVLAVAYSVGYTFFGGHEPGREDWP